MVVVVEVVYSVRQLWRVLERKKEKKKRLSPQTRQTCPPLSAGLLPSAAVAVALYVPLSVWKRFHGHYGDFKALP